MLSCTNFALHRFLAQNKMQLYSAQVTCMHLTKILQFVFSVGVVYLIYCRPYLLIRTGGDHWDALALSRYAMTTTAD